MLDLAARELPFACEFMVSSTTAGKQFAIISNNCCNYTHE
jgi:hypothetical protein